MNRKLAWVVSVVVLVALLGAGGLWRVSRSSRGGRGAGERASAPALPGAQASAREAELASASAPAEAAQAAAAREDPRASAGFEREHQTFALEGARWLDVTVVLPPGLPLEDRPALLGFARKDGGAFEAWHAHGINEELGLDDSFAAEVGEDLHWTRRSLAAHVRLPFPPEASEGLLLLQSRYLHLEPREVGLTESGARTLTLEPELGGWVTGRCTLPAGKNLEPETIHLEFQGRAREDSLMGLGRLDARDVRVGRDLAFELRALSSRKTYAVHAQAPGLAGHHELSFAVEPGEHRVLEIPLRLGGRVAGIVRGEGRPLAGVSVRAEFRVGMPWGSEPEAESGADGTFRLEGLAGGQLRLKAHKDGWRETESDTLTVVEGEELGGIELELAAGLRITGRVQWPDGTPAAEADVSALRARERWMESLVDTKSGSDGEFVLGGLEGGPLELFAQHSPRGARALDAAATNRATASWMATQSGVAAGSTGLVLTLAEPIPVQGRVVDDTGAPVTSFQVSAHPVERPENAPERVTDGFESADGAFTLGVGRAGTWSFHAELTANDQPSEPVSMSVPQGADVLTLVLPRASRVAGLVVDPDGNPIEDAGLHVSDDPQQAAFGFWGGGEGTTDADGRFTLGNLTPGSYLQATHAAWAASERLALDLAPGEARADLVLHLRVGARITGELLDAEGKPEAGRNVSCASGAGAGMAFGLGGGNATLSDAAGRFTFEHVTPGKVTVTAAPSEEELLARFQGGADEAAFLSLMSEVRSASVEVADGGTAHVVLGTKPKRPVRVHGTVSAAGSPLADKGVFAFAEGGALFAGMKLDRTDAGGRYELVLDRPGDYVFSVALREGLEGTGTPFYVEVPEGDEFEQDLVLPLGRIAGVLLGPDGPAAGVPLRLVSSVGSLGLDDLSEALRASSASDGAFGFEHLRPGEYALHVGSDFDGGAQRLAFGQLVVDGLRLEPERALEDLVVRLQAPGKLTGIVRDGDRNPVGGVAIFVRDAAGRALSASSCLTDSQGRFTYSGVAPGRVTASARGAELVSAESAAVEVRAGSTSAVELVVARGTFLQVALLDGDLDGDLDSDQEVRARLRVLDEHGRRVDDLFAMEDMAALLTEGFSSRERRVGPLAPGKYTLIATTLDGKDAQESVRVEAGQDEHNVKLRLK